jgi:hypothetical protein
MVLDDFGAHEERRKRKAVMLRNKDGRSNRVGGCVCERLPSS